MSGASLRIVLAVVTVGMMAVAVIVTTQGPAYAESKTRGEIGEECDGYLQECNEGCDVDWTEEGEANGTWQQCYKDCQERRNICANIEIDDESSTGTTGTPPKGTVVVAPPIPPGGIKDPGGGGKPPKGPLGVINPIPPGGIKDPGGGGKPPKGPLGVINPIPPGGIKEPGGGGKPPKGTVVVTPPIPPGGIKDPGGGGKPRPPKGEPGLGEVNVGGIKDLGGSSGGSGTTTIYRSQRGKKHFVGDKQLGTGTSTQLKRKVKINTEALGGAKPVGKGWNSPSTSGGGNTSQRSRKGKKR